MKVRITVAGDVDGSKEFEMHLTEEEIKTIKKVFAAYDNPEIGICQCENENTGTPYISLAIEVIE